MADSDIQERLAVFDKELTELQNKHRFRLMATVQFPGGALLNVPITATSFTTEPAPATPAS